MLIRNLLIFVTPLKINLFLEKREKRNKNARRQAAVE